MNIWRPLSWRGGFVQLYLLIQLQLYLEPKKIKIVTYVSSPGIIHLSGLLKYVYIYAVIMSVYKGEKERRDYIKINF